MTMTKKSFYILLGTALLPFLLALPIDLIDIDTAQYGEIAREMVSSGDFLHLRDNGKKYLDKPIMTFWTIATAFKMFGISNISFRIPALLTLLLSAWGIYKITYLISENIDRARLAGLIYLVIPGTFTIVLNPIIDIYLNLYLILTYLFYYLGVKKNKNYYYLMYWFVGMGFITKGPISLVIPAISIGGDILFRKDWKRLLEMKIPQGIIIASILPTFWSYILYTEFDQYGPYFFLWLQSFGRFYKKMYDQKSDPGFFYSNFLWGIGTFAIPFVYYAYKIARDYFKTNISKPYLKSISDLLLSKKEGDYVIEFWVFVYLFLISFSKYQLPQYVYWILPGAAIFASDIILKITQEEWNTKKHLIFSGLSLIMLILMVIIPFKIIDVNFNYAILPLLFVGIYIIIKNETHPYLLVTILPVVCMFSIVSMHIYPELLKYQPSKEIGKIIQEMEPEKSGFYSFGLSHSKRSYEFYSARLMKNVSDKEKFIEVLQTEGSRLIVVPEEFYIFLPNFIGDAIKLDVVKVFPAYKIATPKPSFLDKHKRAGQAKNIYLLKATLHANP
jgi:4-amino-4-deoxy-L-arabinose transferase-like glycosyltransferase